MVVGPWTVDGDGVAPLPGLVVEVVDRVPGAGGEEVVADIAYGPFHTPLLVAPGDGDGLWQEVVVSGEVEEHGVEADGIAMPLQHDALQVVVLMCRCS